jgi:uncharacterized protein YndB with AHSA1/START domain
MTECSCSSGDDIAAPRAACSLFLTDPEKIVHGWAARRRRKCIRGLYLLRASAAPRGAFREVVPVHRLAYSFGWDGDKDVPPGSGLIEIDLVEQDGGTLLRMTHSGLPTEAHAAATTRVGRIISTG